MTNDFRILQVEKPDDPLWEAVGGGIHRYNIQKGGESLNKDVCFVLYAPDDQIAGGLIGNVHWGWLYINLLFIKEELRGRGYGHQLMTLAEEEARKLGATMPTSTLSVSRRPLFMKNTAIMLLAC